MAPLPPGSTVGILGGGQLGRMLSIAAARLGLRTHVFEPAPDPPAGDVAHRVTTAAWDDEAALDAFASTVDVVTLEVENVPVAAVRRLERTVPVRPGARALEIAQDRVAEKAFAAGLGIATAPWQAVESAADVRRALDRTGAPALLKTRRLGYDGKGQARVGRAGDAAGAWDAIGGVPAILETLVPFEAEVSVIAARGAEGRVVCFDPGLNRHEGGILRTTTVPSGLPAAVEAEAREMAGRLLAALDYVGVMGVELFVGPGPALLVNEVAPRVHNSGHWTIEACLVDQFQQHVRAVAGWPLGDGSRHSDAEMTNLIGAEADAWRRLAAEPAGLHLYGKAEVRPGRKMGHVTRLAPRRTGSGA
ncbi:MAG TPA: 5-(carboxyamino)imidazole ribonucleotide synthase [Thermohalobaculum sp.]|nr:5-(carboxyamino)imidazole ribonucleotide synthase [Thermohalobaculum sp.]